MAQNNETEDLVNFRKLLERAEKIEILKGKRFHELQTIIKKLENEKIQ
jgi:FtsZ-interacting cell division protein YlmF